MRLCDSYALNFFRSPEKVSEGSTLRNVSFVRIIGAVITIIVMLPVRLATLFLPLLIDIIAHSVTYTR
jgi:hypothetical protein